MSDEPASEPAKPVEQKPEGLMPETRWSLVRKAQVSEGAEGALVALGDLMKIYWQPLYGYARRRGESPADAEDAVQGFYQVLISRGSLQTVDQERGRLRSFLLSAFERFLIDQWAKRSAGKRGGGERTLSLDQEQAEHRYLKEMTHHLTPEHHFDRQWVLTLLERVVEILRLDYERRGKADVFTALSGALEWHNNDLAYAEAGAAVGLNENAVKQAVFRMRKKYRELLRAEVAATIADPEDIDAELRDLLQALSH